MFEEKCIYHSECYKEKTNFTKLRRLSVTICEVETTDENKVQIIETNEQEPESPVFNEKNYVWFVKKKVVNSEK